MSEAERVAVPIFLLRLELVDLVAIPDVASAEVVAGTIREGRYFDGVGQPLVATREGPGRASLGQAPDGTTDLRAELRSLVGYLRLNPQRFAMDAARAEAVADALDADLDLDTGELIERLLRGIDGDDGHTEFPDWWCKIFFKC